jgi:copper(I)-binding protein
MLLHGHNRAALRSAISRRATAPGGARRSSVLRRACAVAAAAVLPVLAGCEAGSNAPVLQWHPPTAGASKNIVPLGANGFLAIRNVFVLGAPPASSLPAGSSAGLFLALVNSGPHDRLLRVSAPGTATSVTVPPGGVNLPRDVSALLTGPAPEIVLNGLTHSLSGGTNIRVLLTFKNAGVQRMVVPVIPQADFYATYSPAPSPTPTPTGTGKRRHHGQASSTASPGATPTPSATATP